MTRKFLGFAVPPGAALALTLLAAGPAVASLVNNGDGTITQTRPDGSQLMWLQDAGYAGTTGDPRYASDAAGLGMSWADANDWANALVFAGHADWRTPTATEANGTGPFAGFGTGTTSEMGWLATADGIGLPSPGPFTNMVQTEFWTGNQTGPDDAISYGFGFGNVPRMKKIVLGPGNEPQRRLGAWAVRSVAVVPVPPSVLLFGSALGLLIGVRRKAPL
ncbi:MAG: hypothetical protein ACE5G3_08995 [Gammaproteobacteria bacterium]